MKITLTHLLLFCFLNLSTAQILVDVDATGTNDGSSWENAYTNLQDAFDNATFGTSIWIAEGTYTPEPGPTPDSTRFTASDVFEIYGGFNGTETMLSERDWETNVTILSGDLNGDDIAGDYFSNRTDNTRNVLVAMGSSPSMIIDGLSIIGGNGRVDDIPQGTVDFLPWLGGGVLSTGDVVVRNCFFSDNVSYVGGAFLGGSSNEIVEIDNCTFTNNYSVFGGVRMQNVEQIVVRNSTFGNNSAVTFGAALIIGNSNALIEDCDFDNNSVENAIGAGVFVFQNSQNQFTAPLIEVKGCNFIGNTSPIGSGLAFNNFFTDSRIIIDSCGFLDNVNPVGSNGSGAAIVLQNVSDGQSGTIPSMDVTLHNSILEGNASPNAGGFFIFSDTDTMNLDVFNCVFEGNIALEDFGAGIIQNGDNSYINASIRNSAFEDNRSGGVAGALGLFNTNDDTRMNYTIDSCVFDANVAEFGGAIWSAEEFSLGSIGSISNSIFADNEGSECCGAILSSAEDLSIDQTVFEGNATEALDSDIIGGGAMAIVFSENVQITHSIFEDNSSAGEGAAILMAEGEGRIHIVNSLMTGNEGISTIANSDSLWLTNVTVIDNEAGLKQFEEGSTRLQNTVFGSEGENYVMEDSTVILVSVGGNLSSDDTMEEYLLGSGPYDDYNSTNPDLGLDFVPNETSFCVDAGNPNDITTLFDLAGVDRIQGVTIDIGAFESAFDTPVRELNALQIAVYPNPFAETLQLSDVQDIEQIRLLDGSGKLVQTMPVESTLSVNSNLPQGIYYLEVLINGRTYFKKLEKM